MNKLLYMFVAASLISACSEQPKQNASQTDARLSEQHPQLAAWVGDYSGVIPCVGCVSRCPDCESMAIDLKITPDQKFILTRTSLSTQAEPEVLTGTFSFLDQQQLKIELLNVKDRSKLILGNDYMEIIDTKSDQPYQAYQDFRIYKQS